MTNPAVGKPWVVPPVQQLLIRDLLTRARAWAPRQTITYRDLREHDYAEFFARIDRAAAMLVGLGVKAGDRVGVMDWDSHRYLELFFAVPMLGAVLHTVNVRLTPEQVIRPLPQRKRAALVTVWVAWSQHSAYPWAVVVLAQVRTEDFALHTVSR